MTASLDILRSLPLRRGSVVVIGGDYRHTFHQRLSHLIGRAHPKLKLFLSYISHQHHKDGVTFVVRDLSRGPRLCIGQDRIDGVIKADSASVGTYIDAVTGKQSEIRLPAIPDNARAALAALGIL